MCNSGTIHHFISEKATGGMKDKKTVRWKKCWPGGLETKFYHLRVNDLTCLYLSF